MDQTQAALRIKGVSLRFLSDFASKIPQVRKDGDGREEKLTLYSCACCQGAAPSQQPGLGTSTHCRLVHAWALFATASCVPRHCITSHPVWPVAEQCRNRQRQCAHYRRIAGLVAHRNNGSCTLHARWPFIRLGKGVPAMRASAVLAPNAQSPCVHPGMPVYSLLADGGLLRYVSPGNPPA